LLKLIAIDCAAVTNVISWCQYVVKGLQQIEWQHIGFEVRERTSGNESQLKAPLSQ